MQRVLVLTSNGPLGDVLQDRLQQAGLQALSLAPDSAASHLPRWGHPAVIVLDIPARPADASGAAAAALVRGLKRPSAVLLLGHAGTTARDVPGGGLLLPRPLDFETLLDAIQQLLAEAKRPEKGARPDRIVRPPLEGVTAEVALGGEARRLSPERQGVRVRNLDLGGIAFESGVDYTSGTHLVVWLAVPGETSPLRLQAEVRWCRRQGGRAAVGCRFSAMPPGDVERLERILAEHAGP